MPPPLLMLAGLLAQQVLPRRAPGGRRRLLAGGVAGGAVAMAAQAGHLFRGSATTLSPLAPEQASSLVTDGAFAVTRNPMYVGLAGLLLAHAIERGHPAQLLPLAGFVALIDRCQIVPEERALAEVFGEAYADYRRRVRRWL